MHESIIDTISKLATKPRAPGAPLVDPPAPRLPAWMKWAAGVWIVNFFAFIGIAGYLGGDALNGYVKDGHYFVAAKGHAIEVSRAVFLYSKWHAIGLIVSLVVLMVLSQAVKRGRLP